MGNPSLYEGTTYEWQQQVMTGIEGDDYGFISPNVDVISVYFDINDSIFIARLYLAPEVELAQVKQQILTTLDSKGIPYNDYPFQWLLL